MDIRHYMCVGRPPTTTLQAAPPFPSQAAPLPPTLPDPVVGVADPLRCPLPRTAKFVRLTKAWVDANVGPQLQQYLHRHPPPGYEVLYAYIKKRGRKRAYGGKSKNFPVRHSKHCTNGKDRWRKGKFRRAQEIDKDIRRKGIGAFHVVILALVPEAEINEEEVALIKQFKLYPQSLGYGYNNHPGGGSGGPVSDETRRRISESLRHPTTNAVLKANGKKQAEREEEAEPGVHKRRAKEGLDAMPTDKKATMLEKNAEANRTPESRALKREQALEQWGDPDFVELKRTQGKKQAEREEEAEPGGRKRRAEDQAEREEEAEPGVHKRRAKEGLDAMPTDKKATMREKCTEAHRTPEARALKREQALEQWEDPDFVELKRTQGKKQAEREEEVEPGGRKRRAEEQMKATHWRTFWYANSNHVPFEPSKKKRKAMRAAHDLEHEMPLYMLCKDGETLVCCRVTGALNMYHDPLGKRVVRQKNEYDSDESVSASRPAVAPVWRSD